MNYFVIGTAGHVDHGKTALIKALTGIDCDRLKEEKERGMTIDIGFAYFNLPNGDCVEIIDVPGHERFIKNMLCGAGVIDSVLLVVAANEGVMPQTREHLDILTFLGIKEGIVVINKIDLVEDEWLGMVKDQIKELLKGTFLENKPLIPVSSVSGKGIEELKKCLESICSRSKSKDSAFFFRLPIDRVFSKEGSGTIITGTITSGTLKVGDEIEVFPQRKIVRVRQIESHNIKIESAVAGQRIGLNLVGVKKEDLMRGNILAQPEYLTSTNLLDVRVRLLNSSPKSLKNSTRIRLYLGTGEYLGRAILLDTQEIKPGTTGLAQLRLETSLSAIKQEKFVIRLYSPMITIGGGEVINPNAKRHRRFDNRIIQELLEFEKIDEKELVQAQALSDSKQLMQNIINALNLLHKKYPLRSGIPKEELKSSLPSGFDNSLFEQGLKELYSENKINLKQDRVKLSGHEVSLNPQQNIIKSRIEEILSQQIFSPPDLRGIKKILKDKPNVIEEVLLYLAETGKIVIISEEIVLHEQAVQKAGSLLENYLNQKREITVSEFARLLNTSRKYALPILQHFDSTGLTRRIGDKRILVGK